MYLSTIAQLTNTTYNENVVAGLHSMSIRTLCDGSASRIGSVASTAFIHDQNILTGTLFEQPLSEAGCGIAAIINAILLSGQTPPSIDDVSVWMENRLFNILINKIGFMGTADVDVASYFNKNKEYGIKAQLLGPNASLDLDLKTSNAIIVAYEQTGGVWHFATFTSNNGQILGYNVIPNETAPVPIPSLDTYMESNDNRVLSVIRLNWN